MNDKKLAYSVKELVENNISTGDKHPTETNVHIHTQKKRIQLPHHVMVFQTFAFLAATRLKPSTNVILMLFFSKSAYENYIGMDVMTIAEELNYSKLTVIRGLNELVDNNVIIKFPNPRDKRRHDYFINPVAVWKGNSYARKKVMAVLDPDQLELFGEPLPKK